jgi:YqaJ-like viral recombinase domain
MTGASVDGFVGDDGFIELKCPKPATHLAYLRADAVPSDYMPQIMWNFACNPGRQWCDFSSYNPEFPEPMVLFTKRVLRDDAKIADLENIVSDFLGEVDHEVAALRATYLRKAAA